MRSFLLTSAFLLCSSAAYSTTPCDYDHNASENYTFTINAIKNVSYETLDIADTARKCVANIELLINDEWRKSNGVYVFGPDISQKLACERAELSAKENALKRYSPVNINSEKNLNCELTQNKKAATIEKVENCREWKTVFVNGIQTRAWRNICD